jgi:hypothetical protein
MLTLLCAALLGAAPPPPVPDDRDPNRPTATRGFGIRPRSIAEAGGKPTFAPRDWHYPRAAGLKSWGVDPYDANLHAFLRRASVSRTADSFEMVRDYFLQLSHLPAGSGDVRGDAAEAVDGSWPDRKIKIAMISRRYERVAVSVIISRGEDEGFTYIKFTLIYDPPAPKPAGP